MRWRDPFELLRDTVYGCSEGDIFQLGAALAFHGVFALAPLLVIAVAQAGVFFGEDAAKGRLDATLSDAVGPAMSPAIADTPSPVHLSQAGWTATVLGFGFVLFAANNLIFQLQIALNGIWGVQSRPGRSFSNMIRSRLVALLLIGGIGALLVLSLIANAALMALQTHLL